MDPSRRLSLLSALTFAATAPSAERGSGQTPARTERNRVFVDEVAAAGPPAELSRRLQDRINALGDPGGEIVFGPQRYFLRPIKLKGRAITLSGVLGLTEVHSDEPRLPLFSSETTRIAALGCRFINDSKVEGAQAFRIGSGFGPHFENCLFDGWGTAIEISEAWGLYVNGCTFWNSRECGISIRNSKSPDKGDHNIAASLFANSKYTSGTTAIRYFSSGGLKIAACKFLDHGSHLILAPSDGVSTSDLIIVGCSFEGASDSIIEAGASKTGRFQRLIIANNQITGRGPSTSPSTLIRIGRGISITEIVGNILEGSNTADHVGVRFDEGSDGGFVADNFFYDIDTAISDTHSGQAVAVGNNHYRNVRVPIVGCCSPGANHRERTMTLRRTIDGVAEGRAPLFALDLSSSAGADVEVSVQIRVGRTSWSSIRRSIVEVQDGHLRVLDAVSTRTSKLAHVDFALLPEGSLGVSLQLDQNSTDEVRGVVEIALRGMYCGVRFATPSKV